MAIVQTGSNLDFPIVTSSTTGTVSSAITVPADAEIVIVGVSNWINSSDQHTAMTFTKSGSDTAMTRVGGADNSSIWETVMFYQVLPDTGSSKTLKWSWGAAPTDNNTAFSVTFWKGIDTASAVRDSDAAQGTSWPINTPTLTCSSGDKIVAFAGFYYGASDGAAGVSTWNNLTEIAEITNRGPAEGTWAAGDPTANTTVGIGACSGSQGGICAVVLKPASGGGGTNLTLAVTATALNLAGTSTLARGFNMLVAPNALNLAGNVALTYTQTTNTVLTTNSAALTLAGSATLTVGSTSSTTMPASPAALTLAGDATLTRTGGAKTLAAAPAALAFAGDVTLTYRATVNVVMTAHTTGLLFGGSGVGNVDSGGHPVIGGLGIGMPVITVPAGGIPVTEVALNRPGAPVSETPFGVPVTKVASGVPVVFT